MNITFQVFLDPAIRGYLDLAESVKRCRPVLFVLQQKVIRLVAKIKWHVENKPMIIHAVRVRTETFKRISL